MGEKEEEQQNAKNAPMPGDLLEPKEELLSEEEEEEEEGEEEQEEEEEDGEQQQDGEHEDNQPENEPNGNELELPQREQHRHKQKHKQRAPRPPNESQQAADDATTATAQAASATAAAAEELQRPGDAVAVGNANGHSLASSDGAASGKFDFNLHILLPFAKRYMRYELPAVGLWYSPPLPPATCHHPPTPCLS